MRNLIILLLAFSAVTAYIYSNRDFGESLIPADLEEKADLYMPYPEPTVGKKIKKDKVTKYESVLQLQNEYAMYRSGRIDFNELKNRTVVLLKDVFIFPRVNERGWLFSAGYQTTSSMQIYAQSDLENTTTVIYKVTYNEEGNKVEKIHDGKYYKLVSVDLTDPNYIIGYDANHDETRIKVGDED